MAAKSDGKLDGQSTPKLQVTFSKSKISFWAQQPQSTTWITNSGSTGHGFHCFRWNSQHPLARRVRVYPAQTGLCRAHLKLLVFKAVGGNTFESLKCLHRYITKPGKWNQRILTIGMFRVRYWCYLYRWYTRFCSKKVCFFGMTMKPCSKKMDKSGCQGCVIWCL